jgi:hypothetical protein
MSTMTNPLRTADGLLALGLRDRWYALCPSGQVRPGQLVLVQLEAGPDREGLAHTGRG